MPSFDPAALVREARARAGLSQMVLAERAGVRRQTVSRVESGALRPTSATLVALLAAAGLQMRVALEPLDADVQRAIDERRATGQAAKDVLDVWSSLFDMDRVSYRLEGLAAAAILGAPVPVQVVEIAFADTWATYGWLADQARSFVGRVRLDGDRAPLNLGLRHGDRRTELRDDAERDDKDSDDEERNGKNRNGKNRDDEDRDDEDCGDEERGADGALVRAILSRECPSGRFWFDSWFASLAARFAPPEEIARQVVVTTESGPIAVQPLDEIEAEDGDVARVLRVLRGS